MNIDSLSIRLFPIYSQALKDGIYDLPRDTTWQNLKKYESKAISFEVPEKWLNLGGLNEIVEVAFDGSGLYFPEEYKDLPIIVGVYLLNQRGSSLEEAKNFALKDYRTNPDRVFETDYLDTVHDFNINGSKGYVLHTRFFRNSNQLNQSRYELILFSEKLKQAKSLMISVQYVDPSYSFEKDFALDVFAARIFSRVLLK